MRVFYALMCALLLLAGATQARAGESRVEKIPLRHMTPQHLIEMVGHPLPKDIESMVPYDLDNSLYVVGTPEGIGAVRMAVALLDKPPAQVRVEFDLLTPEVGALAEAGIAPVEELRKRGVYVGEVAEKIAAAVRKARGTSPILSPRVTCVSGRPAMIESTARLQAGPGALRSAGGSYQILVVPEVHGNSVRATIHGVAGKKTGITFTGRSFGEIVESSLGGYVLFWLAPTGDAPTDLVVVAHFVAVPPEPLAPATLQPAGPHPATLQPAAPGN